MDEDRKKLPQEAVELYSRYIHGEISRRAFMNGAKKFAVGGLTTAGVVQLLMPDYARGQQIRADDERIKATWETIPSPNGHGYIRGYFVRPFSADSRSETPAKLPGILVIHENRGLNPHTMDVARRFALENFQAFAPDCLSSVGGYPGDDYKGGLLFAKLDAAKRTQDLLAAAQWLKAHPGGTGKVGVTGFCFGGSMSNALAGLMGPDLAAAAPYYGGGTPAADVARVKAAILVNHGALDKNLVDAWPAQEAALKANNVRYEGHLWPNSVHGFFNDATPERYNKVTAPQSWERTIAWFNQYVRNAA